MDPWRLTTTAQRRINALAGMALASCVFAWLAGFGSASVGTSVRLPSRTPARSQSWNATSHLSSQAPSSRTFRGHRSWQAPPSATSTWRRPRYPCWTRPPTRRRSLYRYEPISLFEISLTDSSQTLPPEAPSAEVATATTPDPEPENAPAGDQHPRNQRGMPGRGDLHRSIFVGALRTGAQGRRHQGGGAEESDGQAEGQDGDGHQDLHPACRREFCVEGPEGGGQGRHDDDGLRDRRHGPDASS